MVDYEYKDLFISSDSVDKQLIITSSDGISITNDILHNEELSLEESLCSEQELRFGSCEASQIKFKVSNIINSMIGKELTVKMVLNGHTEKPFQFGKYKVISDTPTADRNWREVTAIDSMDSIINSDVASWYNSLTFPMTLKQFRDSLFLHFGITQVSRTLVNDSMTVEKTIGVTASEETEEVSTIGQAISGKDVITAICEINGVFGHIDREGKFDYVSLKEIVEPVFPSNDLYPSSNLYPRDYGQDNVNISGIYLSGTAKYEDFEVKKITKLQIRQEESDIGVIVGTDGNSYAVQGNFLVYGKGTTEMTTIANNLLSAIRNVSYIPCSCEAFGNPCMEVGDSFRLRTTSTVVTSYVLKRTLSGIQALKDAYESQGTEKYSLNVNSTSSSLLQLKEISNTLKRTVEETVSKIVGEGGLESQIKQTAESITSEISRAQGVESGLSSRIKQTAEEITLNVSNGTDNASISLTITKEDGSTYTTQAKTIKFTGNVLFASNLTDGVTSISGDNIKTGTISADRIDVENLTAVRGNFTKEFAVDVPGEGALFFGGTTFWIKPSSGSNYFNVGSDSTSTKRLDTREIISDSSNIELKVIQSGSGAIWNHVKIGADGVVYLEKSNSVESGEISLFTDHSIVARKGCTSDRRLKREIKDIDDRYIDLFYKLSGKTFKINMDSQGKTHIGFIAQELIESALECGLTKNDLYAFMELPRLTDSKYFDTDEPINKEYAIDYEEFIALTTTVVQRQKQEIDDLRSELDALKNMLIQKGVI